jgi:IPT/TIG domain
MGYESWMTDMPPSFANLPLNRVVLPGTHDSGTYALGAFDMTYGPGMEPAIIYSMDNITNATIVGGLLEYLATGPWLLLSPLGLAAVVIGFIAKIGVPYEMLEWSVAQDLDTTTQLNEGIRYFDLRVAAYENSFFLVHGMYSVSVESVLQQVAAFVGQNPKEIVILDFNHFYCMTQELHQLLVGMISEYLGSRLALRTALSPTSTVQSFWTAGTPVVVLYGGDQAGDPICAASSGADVVVSQNAFLWPQSWITSNWPEARDATALFNFLNQDVQARPSSEFYVLQGILTPDLTMIVVGLLHRGPASLLELGEETSPQVIDWAYTQWAKFGLNIIIVDAFEHCPVVPTAIVLNGGGGSAVSLAFVGTNARLYLATSLGSTVFSNIKSSTLYNEKSPNWFNSYGGVALAVFNDVLYYAWTGTNWKLYLFSSSDGVNFGNRQFIVDPIQNAAQSAQGAPALAVFNETLYIAWTANSGQSVNLMSSADGVNFAAHVVLRDPVQGVIQTANRGPALISFNDRLYAAWSDKSTSVVTIMSSADGLTFGNRLQVTDPQQGGAAQSSDASPAMAVFDDTLYIAWTGTSKGSVNVMTSTDGVTFGNHQQLSNAGKAESAWPLAGPALAVFDDTLYLAWVSTLSGEQWHVVAVSSQDGSTFANRSVEANCTTYDAPVLCGFVGKPCAIDGFSPMGGRAGTSVTLTGSGFSGALKVEFGGIPCTAFQVKSSGEIVATVPPAATTGPISVTTPTGGTSSTAEPFIVGVYISGFVPQAGPVGTQVTIMGGGLTGTTRVTFGTVAGTGVTVVSDTEVTATVPLGAPSGQLAVVTPAGSAASTASFTVGQPPAISGFTPTSGPPGTQVTISGAALTNTVAVAFGGAAAELVVQSDQQVTAIVPGNAATGPITVTTSDGGTSASAANFSVTTEA